MSKSAEIQSNRHPNTIFDDIAELTPKQRRHGLGVVACLVAFTTAATTAYVLANQKTKEETVAGFNFIAESNNGKTANDILMEADAKLGVSEDTSPFSYDEVGDALPPKMQPGDILDVNLNKSANVYTIHITDQSNDKLVNTN